MHKPESTPSPLQQFAIEAQPRTVAAELAALPSQTLVAYEAAFCGWRSSGTTSADALRAKIEAIIERQREGHYTLTEAAQVIADARGGNPEAHLARLLQAWAVGTLPVHQGGSHYVRQPEETVCTFDDTVTVAALDAWLLDQTGRGFPAVADASVSEDETAGPVASRSRVHSTKGQKRRDDLWPAIEAAQAKCSNPLDTAEVWQQLLNMALEEAMPVLLGFDKEKGAIEWSGKRRVERTTRDALHKRLHPEKRR